MKRTHGIACVGLLAGAVFAAGAGCSSYRETRAGETRVDSRIAAAERSMEDFRRRDPTLAHFFDTSAGYVVFPKVTKGAAGVGAAHGDGGVVYENGVAVGFSEVTQVTLGVQLGGQEYQELIFFEDTAALNTFKRGNMEFSANASAVGATSGAGAASDFDDGVAVFTAPLGGLMFEASIGGQKFSYVPRDTDLASAQ